MECIDLTLDLETLSLSVNAAILQIGVVAWDRTAEHDPILTDYPPFVCNVDLRSCVIDGFDIDPKTVAWWRTQPDNIRREVFEGPEHPLPQVLESFCVWLDDIKSTYNTETVYLWAHGSDYDIAILRNAFFHYGLTFPVDHRCFRDARTFILEEGSMIFGIGGNTAEAKDNTYLHLPASNARDRHEAYQDALWTSRRVWSIFKKVNERL